MNLTVELAGLYVAIAAAVMGGLVWVIKAVTAIQKQTDTNGGSSMHDAVNRIEKRQKEMQIDLHDARAEFHSHIQWHLDQETK